MNKNTITLQDAFLNQLRKENVAATIFLVNGFQIKCTIHSFDNFTILLDVEGKQQMVYKHAVSTIIPFRNITIKLTTSTAD